MSGWGRRPVAVGTLVALGVLTVLTFIMGGIADAANIIGVLGVGPMAATIWRWGHPDPGGKAVRRREASAPASRRPAGGGVGRSEHPRQRRDGLSGRRPRPADRLPAPAVRARAQPGMVAADATPGQPVSRSAAHRNSPVPRYRPSVQSEPLDWSHVSQQATWTFLAIVSFLLTAISGIVFLVGLLEMAGMLHLEEVSRLTSAFLIFFGGIASFVFSAAFQGARREFTDEREARLTTRNRRLAGRGREFTG
jgi:hypothetical protein